MADKALSSSAKKLLRMNYEREKELKSYRLSPKENAPQITSLLQQIRNDYTTLLLEHNYESYFSLKKDVDSLLWKVCFYKQIEEYRGNIKKAVHVIEEGNGGDDNAANDELVQKATKHLMKLKSAFNKFLNESAVFYADLMTKFEALFASSLKNGAASSSSSSSSNSNMKERRTAHLRCVQKCLLYLGDIARYTEVYAETRDKDYRIAEKYYERAAFLIPTNGNAHNQLAVLATYLEAECVAIYHYCRSLLVKEPFPVGLDNLTVLFDKNGRIHEQLKAMNMIGYKNNNSSNNIENYNDANTNSNTVTTEKSKKNITKKTKTFLVQFIHLHSILFDYNQAWQSINAISAADIGGGSDGIEKTDERDPVTAASPQLDQDDFICNVDAVFGDYDQLLEWSSFGDLILLRFLIICIFSVYQSSMVMPRPAGASQSSRDYTKSTSESLALIATYKMISTIAGRISMIMNMANIEPNDRHKKNAATNRLLPILSVFCEWFYQKEEYICDSHHLCEMTSEATGGIDPKGLASGERLLFIEEGYRGDMISSMIELKPFIEAWVGGGSMSASSAAIKDSRPLREHIELRGFLPLADYYETFFTSIVSNPLGRLGAPVAEELSRVRRLKIVRSFLKGKFSARYESHIAAATHIAEPALDSTSSATVYSIRSSSTHAIPLSSVTVVEFHEDAQKASSGAQVKGLLPLKIALSATESKSGKDSSGGGSRLLAKTSRRRNEKIFKIGNKISGSTNYATSKVFVGGSAPTSVPRFDDEMAVDGNEGVGENDDDDDDDDDEDEGDDNDAEAADGSERQLPRETPAHSAPLRPTSSMSIEDDDDDPGDVVVFRPAFSRAQVGSRVATRCDSAAAARSTGVDSSAFPGGGLGGLCLGRASSFGSVQSTSSTEQLHGGSRLTGWLDNNIASTPATAGASGLFTGALASVDQLEAFLSSSTDLYTSKMSDYNWMLHDELETSNSPVPLAVQLALGDSELPPIARTSAVPPPPGFF